MRSRILFGFPPEAQAPLPFNASCGSHRAAVQKYETLSLQARFLAANRREVFGERPHSRLSQHEDIKGMRLVLTLVGASLLLASSQSRATPLALAPSANAPDFGSGFLNVTYVSTNDTFQATGYTTDYSNGTLPLTGLGSYTLTATITDAGVLTAGTLTIQGDVGFGTQTLLTGSLNTGASGTAFGFVDPPGGSVFEFLFTPTGGNPTVVQDFGGTNAANCGIILDAWFVNGGAPFNGVWTNDFNNDGYSGLADTFAAIPEPSSMLLVLLGGVCCVASLRRRR